MRQHNSLLTNCRAATLTGPDYGLIEDAAIAMTPEGILWAGHRQDIPAAVAAFPHHDLGGRLVTPALIDCHTHVVHGGNRAGEFEMRLKGATYEEVARAGGGIVSTV
ncbi:MAG: imidazolonepropionase, partial [Rhodobacteraceae bacterium]|nr:imidazolonepropionase [Paracoccaceae bacterium]